MSSRQLMLRASKHHLLQSGLGNPWQTVSRVVFVFFSSRIGHQWRARHGDVKGNCGFGGCTWGEEVRDSTFISAAGGELSRYAVFCSLSVARHLSVTGRFDKPSNEAG